VGGWLMEMNDIEAATLKGEHRRPVPAARGAWARASTCWWTPPGTDKLSGQTRPTRTLGQPTAVRALSPCPIGRALAASSEP
jgi:hypothetical protein